MMIGMRSWTPYDTTMPELWRASTSLASSPRSFLPVGFLATARYFTGSLCRSIALPAIYQLCRDNLVQDRYVRNNSEHLLAQFELFYGLSGHIINFSRGHRRYLFTCFLIMSKPPL